jgi:hypothetical protein
VKFSAMEQLSLVQSFRDKVTAAALRAKQQSTCDLCGETMERRNLTFHLDGSDVQWTIEVQVCDCEDGSVEDSSMKDTSTKDRSVPPANRGKRVQ